MLSITQKQLDILGSSCEKHYEVSLVDHMFEFAPELSAACGKQGVTECVHDGIERAKSYGFTNKGPVRLFVESTVILGSEFDSDPQYAWTNEVLRIDDQIDQMVRASRLHLQVGAYLDEVYGVQNEFLAEALSKIKHDSFNHIINNNLDFRSAVKESVEDVFPKKLVFIGIPSFDRLLDKAEEQAFKFELNDDYGKTLIAVLMFLFGSGVFSDPMYPWVLTIVKNSTISRKQVKSLLFKRTKAYLNLVLRNLQRNNQNALV